MSNQAYAPQGRANKKGPGGGPAPSGAVARPIAQSPANGAAAMFYQAPATHHPAVIFAIHSEKKVVLLENVRNAFDAAHLPSTTFTIAGQISHVTDFNPLATNSLPMRLGGNSADGGSYGEATERAIEV